MASKSIPGGVINRGTDILSLVREDRRGDEMLQRLTRVEERELRIARRERNAKNIQLQSDLALVLLAEWTMTDGARKIATAVIKAFAVTPKVHATETTPAISRTQGAKDKVRKSWANSPALQAIVTKQELEKGLRVAAMRLRTAGDEVTKADETVTN